MWFRVLFGPVFLKTLIFSALFACSGFLSLSLHNPRPEGEYANYMRFAEGQTMGTFPNYMQHAKGRGGQSTSLCLHAGPFCSVVCIIIYNFGPKLHCCRALLSRARNITVATVIDRTGETYKNNRRTTVAADHALALCCPVQSCNSPYGVVNARPNGVVSRTGETH